MGLTDAIGKEETGSGVCWLLFLFWLVLTVAGVGVVVGVVLTLEVAVGVVEVPEEGALEAAEERAVVATGVPVVLCPFPF